MLQQIVDLHIHSRYSRACSKALDLPNIAAACQQKGIDIVSTGDFTHPAWLAHIKENLVEMDGSGLYHLNSELKILHPHTLKTRFILGTEVACIYKHRDKVRRVHLLLLAPNIRAVEALIVELEKRKINLRADGRPIMGLPAKELLRIMLAIDPRFVMIPAHAWTPWFSVFGSKSGYDSLEECFEELTPHIRAIETGLSSDPAMNRRLSALDNIALVSNSDAHSLDKLGREANVLSFVDETDVTFVELTRIIQSNDRAKFLYTIEFFPEEGKYHCDGHRDCGVCLSPEQSKKNKLLCPVCKKPLTIGVLYRVAELADRAEQDIPQNIFVPHRSIVPLREIIAAVFGVGTASKKVAAEYDRLIAQCGSEFDILLHRDIVELTRATTSPLVAAAIERVRHGDVQVHPGYDGVYGTIDFVSGIQIKKPTQERLW